MTSHLYTKESSRLVGYIACEDVEGGDSSVVKCKRLWTESLEKETATGTHAKTRINI